jgi:antirestriction protein ArdC
MPPFEAFRDAVSYFATLGHECCHLTGHPSRLNRDLRGRFGSHAYATDELVSEICSAFLCADLQLTPEPREDHAAYLQTWLTVLKNDKRAIFTAAAHAERAAACGEPAVSSHTQWLVFDTESAPGRNGLDNRQKYVILKYN